MNSSTSLHSQALALLRAGTNNSSADFREGQWDAIEGLVTRRARLLLVQRTGWGKSAVYFLTTRLLRDKGAGPTLLVSPLLALMRNQTEAASRFGVRAETVNSSNFNDWRAIENRLRANEIDVLIISPERLSNENFLKRMLIPTVSSIGLFVVDEAHCISDWGHDFRPDYRRIRRILNRIPPGIAVCATTATANDRVVRDIVEQLGSNLVVSRGPLIRESLKLQTVSLPDDSAKLAWLAHWIPRLEGSGIIYALTVPWAFRIAKWLSSQNLKVWGYWGDLPDSRRQERENQLLRNEIKALVATPALGMGFDKPDLGFVIHFHQPGSVIHYYQQVGRAGRSIPSAYGIMLSGQDDHQIVDHFIEQAFPAECDVVAILEALEQSEAGLTTTELQAVVNISETRIERVLKTLAVEDNPSLELDGARWVTTVHRYDPERRRQTVQHMTVLRKQEQSQMNAYQQHTGCLMEFLGRALDDPTAAACGRCAPCLGKVDGFRQFPIDRRVEAIEFLRGIEAKIPVNTDWQTGAFPKYGWRGSITPDQRSEKGCALSLLGDSGWGILVRQGKYHDGRFSDQLVDALVRLVRRWRPSPTPRWVTCVPSLNHPELVPDLSSRIASRLSIPFVPAIRKRFATPPQKEMENSWHQAHNLDGAFEIDPWEGIADPVLLLDDIVDSGWTMTILSALLRHAGSGPVFPLALATNR